MGTNQMVERICRKSGLYLKKHASSILTGGAVVGVVLTTVSAVKATPKALELIDVAKEEKGEELTKLETVKIAGPAYIPSMIFGVSTIACVVGANVLNKRTQASLISAYALLDNSYKEYRNKVTELYGEDADINVKGEIAKDKYEDEYFDEEDDNRQLFYDFHSEQYFTSTMEDLIRAEYNINRDLSTLGYISLNEVYSYLGVPILQFGDEFGWSSAYIWESTWSNAWLDFKHEKVEMEDGLECYIVSFSLNPVLGYLDY